MERYGPVALAGAALLQDQHKVVAKSASGVDEGIGQAHHKNLFAAVVDFVSIRQCPP